MDFVSKIKDETIYKFVKFSKKVENDNGFSIINLKSDHGGKFISDLFEMFYGKKKWDTTITFQHLELPKMVLWKGKIGPFKK
jgi:hypothetical protein